MSLSDTKLIKVSINGIDIAERETINSTGTTYFGNLKAPMPNSSDKFFLYGKYGFNQLNINVSTISTCSCLFELSFRLRDLPEIADLLRMHPQEGENVELRNELEELRSKRTYDEDYKLVEIFTKYEYIWESKWQNASLQFLPNNLVLTQKNKLNPEQTIIATIKYDDGHFENGEHFVVIGVDFEVR